MKFADHLSKKQREKLKKIGTHKKHKKPNEEKVNWEEIMGMNRDIYTRRNGAIRRK